MSEKWFQPVFRVTLAHNWGNHEEGDWLEDRELNRQIIQVVLESVRVLFGKIVTCFSDDRQVLDWWPYLLDTFIARDYTSQITITDRLVSAVMLLGSRFQQCSILGFHVQWLLSPLAGTFHLQLPSWTKWLLTADLQLKLSVLDWLAYPIDPHDVASGWVQQKTPLPTIPLLFHVNISTDPLKTSFPTVLLLV
jgi:hypothetical protein